MNERRAEMSWLVCALALVAVVVMWIGRGWLFAVARLIAVVAVVYLIVAVVVLR
jgi:hypothetical protein